MTQQATAVIYPITYPNGKIYIGRDMTNSINYFGSASNALIGMDFSDAERQSLTITRDILWESPIASLSEVAKKEVELIRLHEANDPRKGYNQWPRRRLDSVEDAQRKLLKQGKQG